MAGTRHACPPAPKDDPWRFEDGAAGSEQKLSAAERTLPLPFPDDVAEQAKR